MTPADWYIAPTERRLPPWLIPHRCTECRGGLAYRRCLVCGRHVCRACRNGSCWTWCCLSPACREKWPEAKAEKRRAEIAAQTLVCLLCGTDFERRATRVLELDTASADDLVVERYVHLQRPRCSCARSPDQVATGAELRRTGSSA